MANRMAPAAKQHQPGAAKTSDLGDEMPPTECDKSLAGTNGAASSPATARRMAHLMLLEGAELNPQLDSDGMSSGTQRSLATTSNGSPSSGIAELEQQAARQQQHYLQFSSSGAQANGGSSSTIVSDSEAGGNLVSVQQHQHQASRSDLQMAKSNLIGASGIKEAKRSVSTQCVIGSLPLHA